MTMNDINDMLDILILGPELAKESQAMADKSRSKEFQIIRDKLMASQRQILVECLKEFAKKAWETRCLEWKEMQQKEET